MEAQAAAAREQCVHKLCHVCAVAIASRWAQRVLTACVTRIHSSDCLGTRLQRRWRSAQLKIGRDLERRQTPTHCVPKPRMRRLPHTQRRPPRHRRRRPLRRQQSCPLPRLLPGQRRARARRRRGCGGGSLQTSPSHCPQQLVLSSHASPFSTHGPGSTHVDSHTSFKLSGLQPGASLRQGPARQICLARSSHAAARVCTRNTG